MLIGSMCESNYILQYSDEILRNLVVLNGGIEEAPEKFTISFGDRDFFNNNAEDIEKTLFLLHNLFICQTTTGNNPQELVLYNNTMSDKCGILECNSKLNEYKGYEKKTKNIPQSVLLNVYTQIKNDKEHSVIPVNLTSVQEKELYSLYKHYTSFDNVHYIYSKSTWNVCKRLSKVIKQDFLPQYEFNKAPYEAYQSAIKNLNNELGNIAFSENVNFTNGPTFFRDSTFQHIIFLLSDDEEFEFFVNAVIWHSVMCAYYRGINKDLSKAIVHASIKLKKFSN